MAKIQVPQPDRGPTPAPSGAKPESEHQLLREYALREYFIGNDADQVAAALTIPVYILYHIHRLKARHTMIDASNFISKDTPRPRARLDRKVVEAQINEMWEAVQEIPDGDPAKKKVFEEATETRATIMENLRIQEQLDNFGFNLFEAVTGTDHRIDSIEAVLELVKACHNKKIVKMLYPGKPGKAEKILKIVDEFAHRTKLAIDAVIPPPQIQTSWKGPAGE